MYQYSFTQNILEMYYIHGCLSFSLHALMLKYPTTYNILHFPLHALMLKYPTTYNIMHFSLNALMLKYPTIVKPV